MTQLWTTTLMPLAAMALATVAFAAVCAPLNVTVRTLVTVITKKVPLRV